MKKVLALVLGSLLISIAAFAQVGKAVPNIKLVDVNDQTKTIPFLGKKVFSLFYVDPDVRDTTVPLEDALNAKKFPKDKFAAIGVINCKDSWIPNKAILMKTREKQQKFPESLILLDEAYTLSNSYGLGACDGYAVILIVGKDAKIKYRKNISTKEEAKAIIPAVIKTVEAEL